MIHTIETINGPIAADLHFSHHSSGRGGYYIKCDTRDHTFTHYTTDGQWIDGINDLGYEATYDQVQQAYADRWLSAFSERLSVTDED